jgi:tetratricopeptide (TPR) repeat protein
MDWLAEMAHLRPEMNRDASVLATLYSRALDYWAVELQKKGQLEQAAARFERALDLNPDNVAAGVNLECNKSLRAGRIPATKISKAVTDSFGKFRTWDMVIGENGPFDEPNFCYEQGKVFIQTKLFRQATQQFIRVKELDPTHLPACLWLTQLYIVARKPSEALQLLEEIHGNETAFGLNRTNMSELLFAEASAHLAKKDIEGANAAIEKALQKFPADAELLDHLYANAAQVYINFGFFSNALPLIEQQLKLAPDNIAALVNKGYVFLQSGACAQAIPPLTRALELTNNPSALFNRAIAYLRCDKLEDAQRDYETLQKAYSTAYQINYALQEIAYRKKDTNAVIRNCQLYLATAPTNTDEAKYVGARLKEMTPR